MEPTTSSTIDRDFASQAASEALTALTTATANVVHAKRLIDVHSRVSKELHLKSGNLEVKTKGTLRELNKYITPSLQCRLAEGKSQFTKASKAYTEATGKSTDESIMTRPEPRRAPTRAESDALLLEVQMAQERYLNDHVEVSDTYLEKCYGEYEKVLCTDMFEPKA